MAKTAKQKTADLFEDAPDAAPKKARGYTAKDIEVLEGLEPVRKRPGMYIGGSDERALHHLAAETLDNAMDEAVAGHADRIEVTLADDGSLTVTDNGRGIPIDAHPKFKTKSALEVILTTLHSGGKFNDNVYQTSGGLHGVGISVVNALSATLHVEVARDRQLWAQDYQRGKPVTKLKKLKAAPNRRGTLLTFLPDPEIFGETLRFPASVALRDGAFESLSVSRGANSLVVHKRVGRGRRCSGAGKTAFPGGILDYLRTTMGDRP